MFKFVQNYFMHKFAITKVLCPHDAFSKTSVEMDKISLFYVFFFGENSILGVVEFSIIMIENLSEPKLWAINVWKYFSL